MNEVTGRDRLLIGKALAIALEIFSRAHPTHTPASDADDMTALYQAMFPEEAERLMYAKGVRWLMAGGLDLRDRGAPDEPRD
jgi:hypothetical protein